MKLTATQLRKIVKEEVTRMLSEGSEEIKPLKEKFLNDPGSLTHNEILALKRELTSLDLNRQPAQSSQGYSDVHAAQDAGADYDEIMRMRGY